MKSAYNPTIFIIDSNPIYGKLIQQYLEVADYKEILIFTDPGECMDYLDLQPDIMISEYQYADPSNSGLNFLKTIKKRCPETNVIFLTSQTDVEIAVKAIRSGATEYLIKSKYAPDSLLRKVNKIVDHKKDLLKNSRVQKKLMFSVGFLVILVLLLVYYYNH
ncbi:MAG: response regulator [Bacteroidales bacterium]|nr:response regulator [Bacteroidales bacterium]